MKAISLHQPWASLIAEGGKRFETRSWPTRHRGLLAIHATVRAPDRGLMESARVRDIVGHRPHPDARIRLPHGAVVAIVRVLEVHQLIPPVDRWALIRHVFGANHPDPDLEMAVGDYAQGRYAWKLELVERIAPPFEARGRQRIWNLPAERCRGCWVLPEATHAVR